MSSLSSLSERERQILDLLQQGMTDTEIATRLTLQRSTIKWYNRQIFNKLNVNNRREAVRLARSIAQQRAAIPYHLPAPPTLFVGRVEELRTVSRLLRESRLVTVIAPGGMGKTRLILAAAEAFNEEFRDGVCYIRLEAVASSDSLARVILRALGLAIQRDIDPERQLIEFLRAKSLLLILDNFEHLLDHTPLLSNLLIHSAHLKLLIGSRERLRLHGEAVYSLGGLSLPMDLDRSPSDAYDLLVQCIHRVQPDFSLSPTDRAAAVEICHLTGGMPLAIELAAAWLDTLSLPEVTRTLAENRAKLTTQFSDVPERHTSIQVVLAATWAQLSTDERAVFMRLSVFRGGCTRAAARSVTGATTSILSALVGKALIRLDGANRYRFHELLRQYGQERLTQSGLLESARNTHSHHYLRDLADHERGIKGERQSEVLEVIDADFENIRAAWLWALECRATPDLDLALESLYWFCEYRDHTQARATLLHAAISAYEVDSATETRWLARLYTRAWSEVGLNALPRRASAQSRRLLRAGWTQIDPADDREHATAAYQRGLAAASVRHHRAAVVFFAHAAASPDPFYAAQALVWQAFSEVDLMKFDAAEVHARAAADSLRAMGEEVGLARALLTLGAAVENKPDYTEAERCYEEAYRLLHRMGAHTEAANVGGWYLAGAALRLGDFERHHRLAQELLTAAEAQNSKLLRARALASLTAAGIVRGEYELARVRGIEALALASDGGSAIVAPIFLSYARFLLGEVSPAQTLLLPTLHALLTTRFAVFDYVVLPLVSALLEVNGFPEHALTAMSLSLRHPASMHAWAAGFFERSGLTARLAMQLGADTMRSALSECPSISAPEVFQWLIQVGDRSNLAVAPPTVGTRHPPDSLSELEQLGDQPETNRESTRLE